MINNIERIQSASAEAQNMDSEGVPIASKSLYIPMQINISNYLNVKVMINRGIVLSLENKGGGCEVAQGRFSEKNAQRPADVRLQRNARFFPAVIARLRSAAVRHTSDTFA